MLVTFFSAAAASSTELNVSFSVEPAVTDKFLLWLSETETVDLASLRVIEEDPVPVKVLALKLPPCIITLELFNSNLPLDSDLPLELIFPLVTSTVALVKPTVLVSTVWTASWLPLRVTFVFAVPFSSPANWIFAPESAITAAEEAPVTLILGA